MSKLTRQHVGLAYGLSAFIWWGGCVFYFKAITHVSPEEIIAHRVVWSAFLLVGFLFFRGRLQLAIKSMMEPRKIRAIAITTVLISINWFTFIWAIGHDQVLQTSLGYYINPLFNVFLGFVFLRERFQALQLISIVLAVAGVAILWIDYGRVPVVALVLAVTFGFYGLVRKVTDIQGVVGLAGETVILTPIAVAYLFFLFNTESLSFIYTDRITDVLLLSAGIITALPLIWFVNAAQRLRLATIGLMQYIAPSMTFMFAVFVFHEPFGMVELSSFVLIWVALILYGISSFRTNSLKTNPLVTTQKV